MHALEAWWRNKNAGLPTCAYAVGANQQRAATGDWCPTALTRDHPDIKDARICLARGSIDLRAGASSRRIWYGIPAETGELTTYIEDLGP